MNIRLLFFGLIMIICNSCYDEPFFKLQVTALDQNLMPIENAEVIVSVQDENGNLIEDANVYKTGFTNSNGEILFEFENLGFFTIETNKIIGGEIEICGSASVGLEENATKEISVLTTQSNCD